MMKKLVAVSVLALVVSACGSSTGGGGGGGSGGGSGGGAGGGSAGGGTGGGTAGGAGGGTAGGAGGGTAGGAGGGTGGGAVDAGTLDLQIITFSDFHGALDPTPLVQSDGGKYEAGGASVLSAWFARERATNPNTIVLTSGDAFGATPPLSNFFEEQPTVKAMNLMGVQIDTLGNHNFDRGPAHLAQMVSLATYKHVSSNLNNLADAGLSGVVSPFHLITVGGVQIGFVGITNSDAPQLVATGRLGNVTVDDYPTSVTKAMSAAAAAKAAGAKLVIALTHLGVTQKFTDGGAAGPLMNFANSVNGFAVVVGDHTDQQYKATINSQPVVENNSKGVKFARIALKIDLATYTVISSTVTFVEPRRDNFFPDGGNAQDPAIDSMLAPYRQTLRGLMDAPMGVATDIYVRGNGVERTMEVPLGDLVADAMRTRYAADVALTNSGGLRDPIPGPYRPCCQFETDGGLPDAGLKADGGVLRRNTAGYVQGPPFDLVRGDAFAVLPFANVAVTRTVTGAQLWAAMEHGVGTLPGVAGRFPQISGFKVVVTVANDAGSRIQSMTLNDGGVILKDDAGYSMVTNDFVNLGGDGYTMLVDGKGTNRDVLDQVLADFIVDAGTITPISDAGRIVLQ